MIVMPGAWRCDRHCLWTNGDCPDCDADLIASHEEGQDEDVSEPNPEAEHLKMCGSVTLDDGREVPGCWVEKDEAMSAPLTTRDALAEAVNRVGLEWSDEDGCIRVDDEEAAEFTADMVRAITLVDGIRLAEDDALVDLVVRAWCGVRDDLTWQRTTDPSEREWLRGKARAVLAALSAQSEQ